MISGEQSLTATLTTEMLPSHATCLVSSKYHLKYRFISVITFRSSLLNDDTDDNCVGAMTWAYGNTLVNEKRIDFPKFLCFL